MKKLNYKTHLKHEFISCLCIFNLMIVAKKRGSKFNQKSYDDFFNNIEYNLRELGFGDVTVNKKMKDFNKILYDILLKIDVKNNDNESFKINKDLVSKYFTSLKDEKVLNLLNLIGILQIFLLCFELPVDNMLEGLKI